MKYIKYLTQIVYVFMMSLFIGSTSVSATELDISEDTTIESVVDGIIIIDDAMGSLTDTEEMFNVKEAINNGEDFSFYYFAENTENKRLIDGFLYMGFWGRALIIGLLIIGILLFIQFVASYFIDDFHLVYYRGAYLGVSLGFALAIVLILLLVSLAIPKEYTINKEGTLLFEYKDGIISYDANSGDIVETEVIDTINPGGKYYSISYSLASTEQFWVVGSSSIVLPLEIDKEYIID